MIEETITKEEEYDVGGNLVCTRVTTVTKKFIKEEGDSAPIPTVTHPIGPIDDFAQGNVTWTPFSYSQSVKKGKKKVKNRG